MRAGPWGVVLAALIAVAPAAWGFVVRVVQDSVEWQIAEAEVVVRGRVRAEDLAAPDADGMVGVTVAEVLKGDAVAGGTIRLVLEPSVAAGTAGGQECLFVLRRNMNRTKLPGVTYRLLGRWPAGLYGIGGREVVAWDDSWGTAGGRAYAMDGRRLTTPEELMAAAREAARVTPGRAEGTAGNMALPTFGFPPESPMRRVRYGLFRVPTDGRLERMAHGWLAEADVRYRARAAEALRYFPSPENGRRVLALTRDAGYQLALPNQWDARPGWRVERHYTARRAAVESLGAFGLEAPDVELAAPGDAYRREGLAAGIVVGSAIFVSLLALGRRGGGGRRVLVGWLAAGALWVAWVGLQGRWAPAIVSWAVGGASYEVVSLGGYLWVLRVADGAPAGWAGVRSEEVMYDGGLPWFEPLLSSERGFDRAGLRLREGWIIATPASRFQLARVPVAYVVGALGVVPLLAVASWAARAVRRRRRRRAGRCVACGYDLRGSPGGRCPECGQVM